MDTADKNKNDILLSKWLYILIAVLFLAIAFICFKSLSSEHTSFGAYGDFVGGVLGTIFSLLSIILVVRTFLYQQVVTQSTKVQLETQRFNDLFFELLRLYHAEVDSLSKTMTYSYHLEDSEEPVIEKTIEYEKKEFFECAKNELQEQFMTQKSFQKNRKYALNLYMQYYIKNKSKLAGYYRTLYRIYDLIDQSTIEETSKKEYLKIVRAQFTEEELFLLRYNAMSYYGQNFIEYLNKYHVLKHLPTFELLEFKDWWKELSETERMGINILGDYFGRIMRRLIRQGGGYEQNKLKTFTKYSYIIRVSNCHEAQVSIIINNKYLNKTNEYAAFDKFEPKKIQQLLDCFIKEIFIYSNFGRYNKSAETFSEPVKIVNNKIFITSGIRTNDLSLLKIEY